MCGIICKINCMCLFIFAKSSAGCKFRGFTSSWKRGGKSVCKMQHGRTYLTELPHLTALLQLLNPFPTLFSTDAQVVL